MAEDKDFEQNETKAEEQLQIVDPPVAGGAGGQQSGQHESGQQQAGQSDGAPTGGAEDPSAEEQNPSGEPDEQENEPLPRTWN